MNKILILLLLLSTPSFAQWVDPGDDNTGNIYYNNGNVGIGTISPDTKLEVLNNQYKQLLLSNHGSEKLYLGSVWSTVGSFISNNSYYNTSLQYTALDNVANGIQFRESGDIHLFANTGLTVNNDFLPTPRLSVKSNGNIGIGTTTPDNKLDVKGTIRAEEVKVETGWADYVFHEDYELKSLSEVSTYIEENHHLPGIPTAEEVAENGIKLGEMNAKLLEKVEELTLYLIEQNEKIEAVLKENEEMKTRLEKLEKKSEP